MPAQAGDAAAVADQNQRPLGILFQAKTFVLAQAQLHHVTDSGLRREPARGQAQAAVGMRMLAHQQVHAAIARNRGDRIFARLRRVGRRGHLHQVARLPIGQAARHGRQFHMIDGATGAARIEQLPLHQFPVAKGGGAPVRRVAGAGQVAQVLEPLFDGGAGAAVDLDAFEQARGALRGQPGIERAAEAAKLAIAAVAQGQHAIMQLRQRQLTRHQAAHEGGRIVGRIAFAIRADQEQGPFRLLQIAGREFGQRAQAHGDAGQLQALRRLRGQFLGIARLARICHQPGGIIGQRRPGGSGRATPGARAQPGRQAHARVTEGQGGQQGQPRRIVRKNHGK